MTAKPASSMSADELWGMITGSLGRVSHEQHAHCRQCHECIFDFVCSNCGTVNPYGAVGSAVIGVPVAALPGVYGTRADEPSGLKKVAHHYCVVHGYRQFDHSACVVNLCPHCAEPVRNGQINDGDAFPIDERGPDDGKYAHRECAQGAKEP